MISLSYYDSPLGRLLIRLENNSVSGLWFPGQRHFPNELSDAVGTDSAYAQAVHRWLDEYFAGHKPDISTLRLSPSGSEFQHAVWDILCRIPYGCTVTYGQIARELEQKLGRKMSAQAVGGAVGRNPISIIIPCHRVIGAKGALTGYAAGVDKKATLLKFEAESK